MINLSIFAISDFKYRLPNTYNYAIFKQCIKVADIIQNCSDKAQTDRTKLLVPNTISVPDTISDAAIFYTCCELFDQDPINTIVCKDGEKIFTLHE